MFAFLTLMVTAVAGEYLFTLPQTMEAGSKTYFCLILDDLKYEGFEPELGYLVNVEIEYTLNKGNVITKENNMATFGIRNSDGEFQACQIVNAPQEPGNHNAAVNVSFTYTPEGQTKEVTDTIISASKDLIVNKPGLITLVQTDKPIYKPGQTVKFRVMTMDYKLSAKTDSYEKISIESPAGLRVMQWDDVPAPNGLISLEMPLSSDPVLGVWNIHVMYGADSTVQPFTVDEYVLPKFEVTVTPPKYLLPTTKTIAGTVCAKYTYGKPVKGSLTLNVCYRNSYYSYYYREQRPCTSLIAKIDGCYEFFIDAEEIKLGHRSYSSWGELQINATVTEEQTGIELKGSSEGPALSMYPLNLGLEDDSNNYYKPGFPYKGRVVVTNPDGSPAPGEEIRVEADYYDSNYEWSNNFTSDEKGIVHFTITDLDPDVGSLSLRADAVVYETDWRYTDDELYFKTYTPQVYARLTKWSSPSNSYLYIPDIDTAAECDKELVLDVYYTAEMDEDYKFLSIVKAGSNVVYTKEHKVDAGSVNYDLDILSVDDSQRLIRIEKPKPQPPSLPPLPPLPELYVEDLAIVKTDEKVDEDGEDNTEEEKEPIEEEIIVPEVSQTLGEPSPRKKRAANLIGHFRLALPISQEMSPSAKVLVFYLKDDKEIVAATLSFDVKSCFRNKVDMRFEEEQVRPGADIKLNLATSPRSTCFVGMVDKSVNLLGGSNQLTPSKVFEHVQRVGRPYNYISYWQEDRDYCMEKNSPPPPGGDDYFYYGYSSPEGVDASQAFRDAEMWVETDAVLNSRPCQLRRQYYRFLARNGAPGLPGSPGIEPVAMESVAVEQNVVPINEKQSEPEKVRSYFPETWLWDIVNIGDDGSLSFTSTIPDTITEWVGNSVCTHGTDGVGVSEMTGVTTFQPFFVSLTLPYSAIRGEVLPVLVTVFNYLKDCLTMELRMKETEGFQFTDASGPSRQFCLCGGDSESTKFYIIPTVIGEIDLEVTAVSIENSGLCDNVVLSQEAVGVSDGVQQQLLIEAEGVPQDLTTGSYICVDEGAVDRETFKMTLPADIVPDSQRATVSVVGDIMGPTLSNLKNLLRMPYGCGEQNMASWSPNIYVLQYLSNTAQLNEEIEEEAEGYMRVGYQRQLKYRHNDNSYSAWGENTYGNATGSLWLTAFVVKSMAKSSPYIVIDMEDIVKSARWLIQHQEENGCFPQVGTVFSSYLKGGLDGDNPAGLTAFTLIAFLEANLGEEFRPSIVKGFAGCLDKFDVASTDTYTLTLMLYANTLYDIGGPRRAEVLQELEQRKVQNGGLVYWKRETEEDKDDKPIWYRAPSAEVEMTAYVIMSRLVEGRDSLASVTPVIQWLTKQRNEYGGFSSTQDTVVALQALAMFGSLTYSGDSAITVEAKNDRLDHVFTITPSNSLVYQSTDVSPNHGPVEITVTGKGCALVQVNLKYNIYKEEDEGPAFDVNVKVHRSRSQRNNCAMRTLEVCASYLKSGGVSNMAIAEVKMPTGWIPIASTLKELMSSNRIQKYELDKNYVQVYFDEFTKTELCIDFEVEQEIEMTTKPSLVRVYDYYETRYSVTVDYEIKTTCGTKEEIPIDNENLDCNVVQCREDKAEKLPCIKCPTCLETIDNADLEKLACNSSVVYKATVGRKGDYQIKIMANIREKEKLVMDMFVNYKMDTTECKCPQITTETENKALIFTESVILNSKSREMCLQKGVTVLSFDDKYEQVVRKVSSRPKLCDRLLRLRRSSDPRSVLRLSRLRRKLELL